MSGSPLVAIGVPTFRRPQYLRALLESIRQAEIADFTAHLIVVDNDPAGSAREVVEQAAGNYPMPVSYIVEETRGLSAARNRLISEAAALKAKYIAFVDDDQFVEPTWLAELIQVARTTGADAVAGRWVPHFESGVPAWAQKSGFWDRPRYATGTRTKNFGTGNVLIKLDGVCRYNLRFDSAKNLTGGEDALFFARFHDKGLISVWCDESLVHERIPPSRATAWWMIKRGYRVGNNHGGIVRHLSPSFMSIAIRMLKSSALMVENGGLLLCDLPFGRARVVPRLAGIARGFGGIVGTACSANTLQEYRETHGQ